VPDSDSNHPGHLSGGSEWGATTIPSAQVSQRIFHVYYATERNSLFAREIPSHIIDVIVLGRTDCPGGGGWEAVHVIDIASHLCTNINIQWVTLAIALPPVHPSVRITWARVIGFLS
jgi:hypothetical protein